MWHYETVSRGWRCRYELARHVLKISSVRVNDSGQYICCAENLHGQACTNFSVLIQTGLSIYTSLNTPYNRRSDSSDGCEYTVQSYRHIQLLVVGVGMAIRYGEGDAPQCTPLPPSPTCFLSPNFINVSVTLSVSEVDFYRVLKMNDGILIADWNPQVSK